MKSRQQVLGQNFLHHKPTIQKITDLVVREMTACTRAPKSILEIGPGGLALTLPLVKVAVDKKLPLVLVERDRHLEEDILADLEDARALNTTLPYELHFMDAATDKFKELFIDLEKRGLTPVFVASNLPYSASSQILANLCHLNALISGAVVMVQKEVAKRMASPENDSDRGSFSLLIQTYFNPTLSFDVGAGAFNPPPKVTSTVLSLRPLEKPAIHTLEEALAFEKFCKMLFSQRRKMIRKTIPPECHAHFAQLKIDGTERPENLHLDTILALFHFARAAK